MFAFLPSIPGLSKGADELRSLAGRVDTARHHGVPNACLLELDLRSMPPETSGFDPLAILSGASRPVTLRDTVAAIYRAAEDPRVAGLIARVQLPAAPAAAVQELREAIVAFTAAKPSLAWAETYPGTQSYYLASAFGEVWMQPAGSVGLIGFASNATFLREAFDKVGIEAQIVARGEYKSAANRFTEHGFTEAHREAVTRLLESVQEQVWEAVAQSRNLDAGVLDALADRAPLLREDALSSGLIDRVGFRDEAYDHMAELVGVRDVSEENAPPRLYLSRYAGAARPRLSAPVPPVPGRRKPTVAVINIDGTIVDGRGGPQFLPFGDATVGSDTIVAALQAAAADDSVSAIVLRINSPGGSVPASETMWREVKRARERGKPLVASMGGVAASGGYYVAAAADLIVASPATITGSIGVITGKLVIRDLLERLGVGLDTVRTNANADAWSMETPFTPEQRAHREAEADLVYTDFVKRVADGRNLTTEAVDRVARGRVWTGADARERGLVDELGGFRTALRRAKSLAGLDEDADVRVVNYPGGSLLDLLRPRTSSQPAAASVPDALGALLGSTIGSILDNVQRSYTGTSALWPGSCKF
ncbi:signal peptide peptidase SppA [Mycobacterium sp. 94-17]|uniref:signal peptide peptidase SppA n=1 Tax=Mycobacterium sp. 94-17 TaxID=2986147 RepID=UPI002D1EDF73|nr:signal peptide peptidase SppA [Mycobacterium sp. 94-17]MEB4208192.1 signal peptide peptidase SppA [Mycobacterium sp. 94-17]